MACMLCVAAEQPTAQSSSRGAPEATVSLPGRSEKRSLYTTRCVSYCFWYHPKNDSWIISIRNRMILVTLGINGRYMPWFPCQFSCDLCNCFWTFTPACKGAFATRDHHPLSLSALCSVPCMRSLSDCSACSAIGSWPSAWGLQSVWLWTELHFVKKQKPFITPCKSTNYRKHKTKPQAFHLFLNASRDVTGI